jgi:hypothetical protein
MTALREIYGIIISNTFMGDLIVGWDEVRDEKEGYVRVRKANTRGAMVGKLGKANDDPTARGYIELNKEDLGGMDGGGGPHSHSEYARKTHDHDDKADVNHTHDTTHTHNEFADKGHTHPPQDLTHDHFGQYAGKAEFDAHHHDEEYLTSDDLPDPYDDSEIKGLIANEESARVAGDQSLQSQIDVINISGYDDTEVRSLIQDNTDALDGKSDTGHDHIHNHNGLYSPTTHLHDGNYADANHTHDGLGGESYDDSWIQPALDAKSNKSHTHDADYAGAVHGHDEFMVLQNQINGKADEDHVHEVTQEHTHEGMVVSESVVTIVKLTEAEYEALADKDPSTLYLVV